ncbi:MAG: hypothetical protein J7L88_04350 [Thermoplasmata archaeon]|nr:hypothetical protein [Thermoplasmata archaeon]
MSISLPLLSHLMIGYEMARMVKKRRGEMERKPYSEAGRSLPDRRRLVKRVSRSPRPRNGRTIF